MNAPQLYTRAEAAGLAKISLEALDARIKHLGIEPRIDEFDLARIAKPFRVMRVAVPRCPEREILAIQDRLDAIQEIQAER